MLKSFEPHLEYILRLLILPDGNIAIESADLIKVFNPDDGLLVYELEGHKILINDLVLLSKNWIASASNDKAIKIWDIVERKLVKTLYGHENSVESLLFKNGLLLSSTWNGTIKLWDPFKDQNELLLTLEFTLTIGKIFLYPELLSNGNLVFLTESSDDYKNKNMVLKIWNTHEYVL